jgi:hypothetical protein
MDHISYKFLQRLPKDWKLIAVLRQAAAVVHETIKALKKRQTISLVEGDPLDPLHTVYVAVQHAASIFAERVSVLDEFESYYEIVFKAEKEYMPSSPPMSPLTRSYFTTWAFFDLGFGPHQETLGKCLLDAGILLAFDKKVMDAVRACSESCMGIYEIEGFKGSRSLLKTLITGEQFECHVPTGYRGHVGELLYGRVLPPISPVKYHVFLTTPYVLLNFSPEDWTAYVKRSLLELRVPERMRLAYFLKHGKETNHWNEFIFQAYHHHQFDAIFLSGLPDVPESLPHGPKESA